MRRRELLSVGTVLVVGVAGCAAEPIEDQNESEVEEEGGPGEGVEEENATADDGDDSDDGETDWDVDPTADDDDAEEDGDDEPSSGDDPMVDDGGDSEGETADDGPAGGDDPSGDDAGEFEADETFEGEGSEGTEPLTIGVVGPTGELIEDASVTGERASDGAGFEGETGDGGTYTAEIPEGIYTIEVDHPAYEVRTVEYTHEDEREVAIELEASGDAPSVSGLRLVVTDTDGAPIEGASVAGEGEPVEADVPLSFSGETDAEGEYADRIYETEYVIDLAHPDYEDRTVEYDHDGPTELVVELGPGS